MPQGCLVPLKYVSFLLEVASKLLESCLKVVISCLLIVPFGTRLYLNFINFAIHDFLALRSNAPFTKWQETKPATERHLRDFSIDTLRTNMDLKQFYNKEVVIVSVNGQVFEGKVNDYIYSDENNLGKESVILDAKSGDIIEFTEEDIASIEIV